MKTIKYKGKMIGRIEKDEYVTHRRPEHFFKKYQGFGFSEKLIDYLLEEGAVKITVIYYGAKTRVYKTTIAQIFRCGIVHYDGEDKQYIIPVAEMIEEGDI